MTRTATTLVVLALLALVGLLACPSQPRRPDDPTRGDAAPLEQRDAWVEPPAPCVVGKAEPGRPIERCNSADEDCNGVPDEPYAALLNQPCWLVCSGKRTEGRMVCDGEYGVECHVPGCQP